ncbi:hypothetical protein [Mycolicibacterium holsaticum]|uniref:Uncharacterized protein n=1 Tax=Mycolicibacterium holsaticum TaxID=152142 RepID=A0A1E3S044_9MYCO|nr:hypothetical protein [Mycolicibacterium holsaticum]ODQ95545.1 hypothetical protein BHQ17_04480 [Mycolicibacterium holsaticum]
MTDQDARKTFKELFPRGSALSESPDSYQYGLANRCLWTDPDGGVSDQYQWPVTSVARVIDPKLPHPSPTAPIEAGSMHEKASDLFILLTTAPPEGVWCKPYDSAGPAGTPPRVNLPNKNRDGGEPWFCRRHRWC